MLICQIRTVLEVNGKLHSCSVEPSFYGIACNSIHTYQVYTDEALKSTSAVTLSHCTNDRCCS